MLVGLVPVLVPVPVRVMGSLELRAICEPAALRLSSVAVAPTAPKQVSPQAHKGFEQYLQHFAQDLATFWHTHMNQQIAL